MGAFRLWRACALVGRFLRRCSRGCFRRDWLGRFRARIVSSWLLALISRARGADCGLCLARVVFGFWVGRGDVCDWLFLCVIGAGVLLVVGCVFLACDWLVLLLVRGLDCFLSGVAGRVLGVEDMAHG